MPLGQSGRQTGEIGSQHVACSNAPRSYDRGYYARVASVVRRGDRQPARGLLQCSPILRSRLLCTRGLRRQTGGIGIQHVACSNAPRSYDRGYHAHVASVVRRGGDRQHTWPPSSDGGGSADLLVLPCRVRQKDHLAPSNSWPC